MWTLCRVLVRRAGLRALFRAVTPADRSGRSTLTIAERPPRRRAGASDPFIPRRMQRGGRASRERRAGSTLAPRCGEQGRLRRICTAASRTGNGVTFCVALLRDQASTGEKQRRRGAAGKRRPVRGSASARRVFREPRGGGRRLRSGVPGRPLPSTAPHSLPPGPTRDGRGRGVRGGGGGGGSARGKGCGGGRAGARHTALEVGAVEVALHLAADRPGHPTEVAVERLLVEQLRRLRRSGGRG